MREQRELCTCGSPIISIDSVLEHHNNSNKIDQAQEMGCLNKKCPKYNVSIRTERHPVNY